jgi:hypothetical protein
MIRIATTDIRKGDLVRTYSSEGIVTSYRWSEVTPSMIVTNDQGVETHHSMKACGTVELLSDLHGRIPAAPFGRW